MRMPGWNPLAGMRLAGSGFADVSFNVTKRLDWLSFVSTDEVDNAVRFLPFPPASGNSKTTGTTWSSPWASSENPTITEWFFRAGSAPTGGTNIPHQIRQNGIVEDTMTVLPGTTEQDQTCAVALNQGERLNIAHDGNGITTSAKNVRVSLRIERDV